MTRQHVTCKLCDGSGVLQCGDECCDCGGSGLIKKGSEEHNLQSGVKYRHGKNKLLPPSEEE